MKSTLTLSGELYFDDDGAFERTIKRLKDGAWLRLENGVYNLYQNEKQLSGTDVIDTKARRLKIPGNTYHMVGHELAAILSEASHGKLCAYWLNSTKTVLAWVDGTYKKVSDLNILGLMEDDGDANQQRDLLTLTSTVFENEYPGKDHTFMLDMLMCKAMHALSDRIHQKAPNAQ